MSVLVLVHGAWHGGWCWNRLAPLLREAGHEVHTPTLTGLGDRAHLLDRSVNLSTHIEDVARLLDFYDLRDVTLVGHSYGGMVISGVAEQAGSRLARLVYLDACVPAMAKRGYRWRTIRWRPSQTKAGASGPSPGSTAAAG